MRQAGARVVALEPQAPFARFLRLTLPADIVFVEAAAGSEETEAEMAVSSRHPTVSSLRTDFVTGAATAPGFDHVRWDRRQRVRVVTLDGLIHDHGPPAYIKIDVEGFELEVLGGLSHPVPMISVEFLPGFPHLTHAVLDRLGELGDYRFNPVVGEGARFLWSRWLDVAAVGAWLDTLSPEATSGDLFARLAPPGK
jgi:FkbM family methyltransferase